MRLRLGAGGRVFSAAFTASSKAAGTRSASPLCGGGLFGFPLFSRESLRAIHEPLSLCPAKRPTRPLSVAHAVACEVVVAELELCEVAGEMGF